MGMEAALYKGFKGFLLLTKILSAFNFPDRQDRVALQQAIQSLREIYFFPSGLLRLLEAIERGDEVDAEQINDQVNRFDHLRPRHIAEALSFLNRERFSQSSRLTIEDVRLIDEIAYGKISARGETRRFLQEYIRRPRDKAWQLEATRILGQIARLNEAITLCESTLQAALRQEKPNPAKGRSKRAPPTRRPAKKATKRTDRSK